MKFVTTVLLCAALLASQRRDFLNPVEIDQVREAQEPAERMKLYVQFARARLDSVERELGQESEKRGLTVHDLIEEYVRIIDAIDDLTELGVTKRALLRRGLDAVVRAEPEFLKRLQALETRNPKDIQEFRFVLSQAIETTQDSLESSRETLKKQPADKKLEKQLEREAQKEEERRRKNEPPPKRQ
jgi:hypothetical protein